MDKNISYDFSIQNLGECMIPSPVNVSYFTPDSKRLLFNIYLHQYDHLRGPDGLPLSVEVAGPREKIFFDPSKTKAAIVTCGGLCPGINDVVRSLVMELYHRYGVRNTMGIRYGFQGLIPKFRHPTVELTPDVVKDIHTIGGSILSSSRGRQDIGEMTDALKRMNVDLLFCVGGDGTMRATECITEEITRRGLNIGVIGIPKTIDNDLNLIQKTFGFDTAISESVKAIQCAHVEAKGAPNGIGLVKIMGRQSGHIAAGAALAQTDVNFVLIPEVPFDLEGENGFLKAVERASAGAFALRDPGRRGCRSGAHPAGGPAHGNGCLRESPSARYRGLFKDDHRRILQKKRHGDQPEVHRSELYDPQCSGQRR